MRPAALALVLLAASCTRKPPTDAPIDRTIDRTATLLGGERGLDHIGIAVHDLPSATHTFHDLLGFSRPTEGHLPNGIDNVNYYFPDGTYLETMVAWDRARAPWLADFTDYHEGALFAVLSAFSVESTTAYLARRGIPIAATYGGTIQTAADTTMPRERWKTFFLDEGRLPGDPLFFIAYPRDDRDAFLKKLENRAVRRQLYHDNTALGLRAVWIAVPDLPSATRAYEALGLPRVRPFTDPQLAASGQILQAGEGQLWLLAPASQASPIAAFLRERGRSAVLGLTLAAGSVPAAQRLLRDRTGRDLPIYDGALGKSLRVPPDRAHGAWLELAQHLVPGATP